MKTLLPLFKVVAVLFACALCLVSGFTLRGQDLSISARLDRGEIAIGEQALLTLKIRTEDLDHTMLLIPPDSALHKAEALSFVTKDTVAINDRVKEITAEMVITSFDSTLVEIPAFGVRLGAKEVYADPLYLKVTVPQVDLSQPEKFYPNKKSWSLPYTFWEIVGLILPWFVGVALVVAVFFFLRYLRKLIRLRRNLPKPEPVKKLSPYEKLSATLAQVPLSLEDRIYYTQLDFAFREFLAETVLPNAMEMSTTQLVRALQKLVSSTTRPQQDSITLLLDRMTLAKFAKETFGPQWKEQDSRAVLSYAELLSLPQQEENENNQREELKQ